MELLDRPHAAELLPDIVPSPAINELMAGRSNPMPGDTPAHITSCFGIALHMHQPLIPAGRSPGHSIISNLQFMLEHPEIPDSHNATAFLDCYRRLGTFIPQLLAEGKSPRVMLDYSGCLLHGLQQMGANDVIDSLLHLVHDPACSACVEWVGTAWGHAVAPSTSPQDFRLHVRAWQAHFASIFGPDALSRVRGFSPPEMALPNEPDACYEFVSTLLECGYRWVFVQEHTVEEVADGGRVRRPHIPNRLVARNSAGKSVSILAIVKTQGSDTKLVGQMQPYYEARGLSPMEVGGKLIPPMVTQISDGENGGVMMNEFPPKYMQVMREASGSTTPPANVTEYLDHLSAIGINEQDFPTIQPIFQHRIWSRVGQNTTPAAVQNAIADLRREGGQFHLEGGSWTSERSWVRNYESVLKPIDAVSQAFHNAVSRGALRDVQYQRALYYVLLTQTSCFRFWGEGMWTDFARKLCEMAMEAINNPA